MGLQLNNSIEDWLQPIEGGDEYGAGSDIRIDKQKQERYYDLKDYRRQLHNNQESLLLGESEDLEGLSWHDMVIQADAILRNDSKDMEVACWLVEALSYRDGLDGIQQGLDFLGSLIDRYTKNLYPHDDPEDEQLLSLASLSGKNNPGTLVSALNLANLVDLGGNSISLWNIYQADAATTPTDAQIKQLFLSLSEEKGEILRNDILQIEIKLARLDEVIEEQYSEKAPSLSQMRDSVSKANRTMQVLLQKKDVESSGLEEDIMSGEGQASTVSHNGRDGAFRAIQDAMGYYQQYEPHSPINNLLQRALDWSSMSLLEILAEILSNESELNDVARVLGFQSSVQQ